MYLLLATGDGGCVPLRRPGPVSRSAEVPPLSTVSDPRAAATALAGVAQALLEAVPWADPASEHFNPHQTVSGANLVEAVPALAALARAALDTWRSKGGGGEATNEDRARRGAVVALHCGTLSADMSDPQALVTDLLADVLHWAHREGLDVPQALSDAETHFRAEAAPGGVSRP